MHALHSLAHRAPPATRTRVRWQPYSSNPPSCSTSSSRSSPASYLNTPASSVTSSPQTATLGNDHDRIRQILSTTTIPKDVPNKDTPRNKFITSLVDQAVKSLSEIWHPQDIPPVFVASAHTMVLGGGSCEGSLVLDSKLSTRKPSYNTQLPSPISPSNRSSPSLSSASSPPSSTSFSVSEIDSATTPCSRANLVPIKSFVHEVLRRSRTSGCVLQTALCYLEAIRSKVPELVRAEKAGEGVQGEVDRSDWITPATPEELEREREFAMDSDKDTVDMVVSDDNLAPTVRVDDISRNDSFSQSFECSNEEDNMASNHQRLPPAPKLPPLPPLPSPLLCPRRAFLASLILASKFTQDKCYSNRAWAKLSGLPPREIGRCERALGEALDWRLWVGKQPSATPISPPLQAPMHRSLTRVQSESCLNFADKGPFFVREQKANLVADNPVNRSLRRHSTLPADAFAPSSSTHQAQVPWCTSVSSCDDDKMDLSSQLTSTEPHMVMGNAHHPSTMSSTYSHHYLDKINQSPSPATPSLTDSPSSTDSCSGERTIQMSSLDDSTAPFNVGNTNSSDSWPWLDNSDVVSCPSMAQSLPSERINRKISPPFGGPVGVSSVDFTGPAPFKISDIDDGPISHPLVSVLENAVSVYPSRW